MHNKKIHMVTFILLVVGGLNWLLVAVADLDLVMALLGSGMAAKVVYILVGLSAIYEVVTHKASCVHCGAGKPASGGSGASAGGMM